MPHEELERPQVRQLRGRGIVMSAIPARKSVILALIIVKRDIEVSAERAMDSGLSFGSAVLIAGGDVQHQRALDVAGFVESSFDADAVVPNRTVGVVARSQQICELSAKAKPYSAHFPSTARMSTQK